MQYSYVPVQAQPQNRWMKPAVGALSGFVAGCVLIMTAGAPTRTTLYTVTQPAAAVSAQTQAAMPVRGAQAQAPAANFVKAAAAGAAAVTTAAPAMAEPVQQVVAVAEADIFQTALTMVGAVLVGLVIGFAFLFTEDQASSE